MSKKIGTWLLATCLLAITFFAEAQQRTKSRGLVICQRVAIPRIPGPTSKHSGKGSEISVTTRLKTYRSNIATWKASRMQRQGL